MRLIEVFPEFLNIHSRKLLFYAKWWLNDVYVV